MIRSRCAKSRSARIERSEASAMISQGNRGPVGIMDCNHMACNERTCSMDAKDGAQAQGHENGTTPNLPRYMLWRND